MALQQWHCILQCIARQLLLLFNSRYMLNVINVCMMQKRLVTPACWRLYDGTWQLLYILQKGAESAAVLSPPPVTSGPPPHPQLQRKDSLVGQAHFLMDTKSSGADAPEAIVDTSECLKTCHRLSIVLRSSNPSNVSCCVKRVWDHGFGSAASQMSSLQP